MVGGPFMELSLYRDEIDARAEENDSSVGALFLVVLEVATEKFHEDQGVYPSEIGFRNVWYLAHFLGLAPAMLISVFWMPLCLGNDVRLSCHFSLNVPQETVRLW